METSVWLSTKQLRLLREALESTERELEGEGARGDARLGAVRSALVRLERGTYGECSGCDEPIAFATLKARPEASLCPVCEKERRG